MNLKIKRAILLILIILNCVAIYKFSAQNAEKSEKTSGVVVNRVVNGISKVNKNTKREKIENDVTFWVRKLAHFSIYTMLGFLVMNFCNTFEGAQKKKLLICVFLGMLYAITDEVHQHFVGGRSPEIRDVCIDTLGVLCGSILAMLAKRVYKRIKDK